MIAAMIPIDMIDERRTMGRISPEILLPVGGSSHKFKLPMNGKKGVRSQKMDARPIGSYRIFENRSSDNTAK